MIPLTRMSLRGSRLKEEDMFAGATAELSGEKHATPAQTIPDSKQMWAIRPSFE